MFETDFAAEEDEAGESAQDGAGHGQKERVGVVEEGEKQKRGGKRKAVA